MCTNQELQDQITKLAKQNKDEHSEITAVLAEWTPLMKCYQEEVTRSKAYKIVGQDLRSGADSWKFWLSLAAVFFTVLSALFWIWEMIKK